MAGVICSSCQAMNTADDSLCASCGNLLTEELGQALEPLEEKPPDTPAPERCPACGAAIPEPTNLVCVDCLEPLTPRHSDASTPRTRREEAALRLLFAGKPVEVSRPGFVLLGRDPDLSPVAAIFTTHDNVSRRHASVGVERDGGAWVRDEHSTNGTFVNNKPVPRGHTAPLFDGDQLRMGTDVVAQVKLGQTP